MKQSYIIVLLLLSTTAPALHAQCFTCADAPPGTFFCDDFESSEPLTNRYFEVNSNGGDLVVRDTIGRGGTRGLRVLFQQGEVGAGALSKSFGKIPGSYIARNAERTDTSFTEIYWRMDVRHQPGWTGGGPAKLSRALVMANDSWAQGMMAHLWSGGPDNTRLIADPASGIDANGTLKATKYNDFANLRWLGIRAGTTPMFADENAGKWYCVVGHVKLNSPGHSDGVFEFWINDTLQASATTLNWHGNYNANPTNMTINAVFFENYWNSGSPVEQERYFDNLLISTRPLPCACASTTSVDPSFEIGNERVNGRESNAHDTDVTSVRYFDMLGRQLTESEAAQQRITMVVKKDARGSVRSIVVTSIY
ncbi:MAG: hypothetical protein SGJ05_10510 [bacterium]|nr:hypothetical protein [bacterium]